MAVTHLLSSCWLQTLYSSPLFCVPKKFHLSCQLAGCYCHFPRSPRASHQHLPGAFETLSQPALLPSRLRVTSRAASAHAWLPRGRVQWAPLRGELVNGRLASLVGTGPPAAGARCLAQQLRIRPACFAVSSASGRSVHAHSSQGPVGTAAAHHPQAQRVPEASS